MFPLPTGLLSFIYNPQAPTHINPADHASRGLSANSLVNNDLWKKGPKFLWETEEFWPQQPDSHPLSEGDSEVKKEKVCSVVVKQETCSVVSRILSYFSDCHKLRRFVALMHRAVKGFRHLKSDNTSECDPRCVRLSADDLLQAEKTIVQWVQDESFPGVVHLLQSGKTLLKGSNSLPSTPLLLMGIYVSVAASEMRQFQMTRNIPWYFRQIHQSLNFLFGPSIRDMDMVGRSRFYPNYEKGTESFMVTHLFVACWNLVWSVDGGFMVLCNRKWRTCWLIVWHLISPHSVTQGWTILDL